MVEPAALYVGHLRHRRFGPRHHAFTYPLFMAYVDIDRIPAAMRATPLTAYNRFHWAAFHERDHVGDPARPLRERVAESAAAAGVALPPGPVYLLTHLRYLGHNFNPISFYYCHDTAGRLAAVMGEVHSTFGEERCYWIDARAAGASHTGALRQRMAKTMHVSPFMPMAMDYEFVLTPPEQSLVAHMNTYLSGASSPAFDATLTLTRRPWRTATVARALATFPAMTLGVVAAIHWEALRLWLKGVPHFDPPSHPARDEARSTCQTETRA
jgi:DUF1365 family protein